jgi:hypothetical protein
VGIDTKARGGINRRGRKGNAKDAKKAVALLRQGKVNTKSKKKKVY